MACIWLFLGKMNPCLIVENPPIPPNKFNCSVTDLGLDTIPESCKIDISKCQLSWIYKNGFWSKPKHSQYIFAFYWIFEVITTVGYGDYYGSTPEEYIFSIGLEFIGLTFFSFLMGSINGIFNTKDNFDDLIEEKLDSLDMWIKKIEKSNKPFHI